MHLHQSFKRLQVGHTVTVECEHFQILQPGQGADILQTIAAQMKDSQILHPGQRTDIRDLIVVQVKLGHGRQCGERLEVGNLVVVQIQPLQRCHIAQGHEIRDLIIIQTQAFQTGHGSDLREITDSVSGQVHAYKGGKLLQNGKVFHPRIGKINVSDLAEILSGKFTVRDTCRRAHRLLHCRIFPCRKRSLRGLGRLLFFILFFIFLLSSLAFLLFLLFFFLTAEERQPPAQRRIRQNLYDPGDQKTQQYYRNSSQCQHGKDAGALLLIFHLILIIFRNGFPAASVSFGISLPAASVSFGISLPPAAFLRSRSFLILFFTFLFLLCPLCRIRPLCRFRFLYSLLFLCFHVFKHIVFILIVFILISIKGRLGLSRAEHRNTVVPAAIRADRDSVCQFCSAISAALNTIRHYHPPSVQRLQQSQALPLPSKGRVL